MNAIISNGDYTASVQLPVERKQLAGALSYLGKNHASTYDIKYNEESDQGLSFTLECRGVVENAIAKAIPTGFRFHTFNDTIALMHNLPYEVFGERKTYFTFDFHIIFIACMPCGHNVFGTQFERVLPASAVANCYALLRDEYRAYVKRKN